MVPQRKEETTCALTNDKICEKIIPELVSNLGKEEHEFALTLATGRAENQSLCYFEK